MSDGAVYSPFASSVPFCGVKLQITALLDPLVTVAVNCCVCPAVRLAVVGLMVTLTVAVCVRVTRAVPLTLESALLVAVTVMLVAVLWAPPELFPTPRLPTAGLMLHVTPVLPEGAVHTAVRVALCPAERLLFVVLRVTRIPCASSAPAKRPAPRITRRNERFRR